MAGAILGELGRHCERIEIAFCETVVEYDDSVWQAQHSLRSFFVAAAVLCRPRQKMAETQVKRRF